MTKKIEKKKEILRLMVEIYKKAHPDQAEDLLALETYAIDKMTNCPNKNKNIVCKSCTIHCYQKEQRQQIKKIMRFSGPRMLVLHPILTIEYFFGQ
ncbi:MAG: nitrous oxide-stimulated promoter family protein [Bacillota bacterium]|nr:nitrous oxide-stimulated promoter family protein [Bacillota bacterium]